MFRQLCQFVLVGALATTVQYLALIAFVRAGGLAPAPASDLGFVLASIVNYLCNYHYTFRSRQRHAVAALRFAGLASIGLLLNSVIVHVLVAQGLNYLLAQVGATTVVLLWNFSGSRLWTFRGGPATHPGDAGDHSAGSG